MGRAAILLGVLACIAAGQERDGGREGNGRKRAEQDESARARFLASAEKAIRSREGGLFVVKVEAAKRYRKYRPRYYWVAFTVEEVLKPYRENKNAYYIPLEITEDAPDDKPRLHAGKRYLLVTGTKDTGLTPTDSLELTQGDDTLLEKLRKQIEAHAVYGPSSGLRTELEFSGLHRLHGAVESHGVQTRHANGLVDPEPFGFERDALRKAVGDGMSVLLVRPLDTRGEPVEVLFDVREDLARAKPATSKLWVHDPVSAAARRARRMPAPYKFPKVKWTRSYIVLVKPQDEGAPLLEALMPTIHDDGPTVRKVRSWLGKGGAVRLRFELDGKPHAPKGVRAGLGAARAAFSDERMTFEGVKPGKHALLVDRVEGFERIAARAVEVGSGETVEVVIALERES